MTDTLPPTGAGAMARLLPDVWDAYTALGKAAAESGPLDAETRRLVKLALAIGANSEGAVHSHAKQALAEGLSAEQLRHVVALAVTTLGLPKAVAALSWVNDIADAKK